MPESFLVIIPTYNEIENIKDMIEAVLDNEHGFHLLIIDDNSPDGTAMEVKNLQQNYPERLHILERSGKLGLGTAYILGFRWGLEQGYDIICEMDCDFSHNPEDIIRHKENILGGADVSIGSRYIPGGDVKGWDNRRVFLSKGASLYTRLVTRLPVKDTTSGFVAYRRVVLETMDLSKIIFKGYAFQIQMKYACLKLGFKLVEIPITFIDRVKGTSKLSSNIISEAILGVLKIWWSGFTTEYRSNAV
ncbi:MAG: polyprenol monophosphomannose synthase [Chitinophagales bacterium]|jgi:dolichol-phosphate mannosyltransferase|nr:polyprenol monophosphomannose synthase [Chitinophagales bacterium]